MGIPLFLMPQTEASVGAGLGAVADPEAEGPTVGFEQVFTEVREALDAESGLPEGEGEISTASNATHASSEGTPSVGDDNASADDESVSAEGVISGAGDPASEMQQALPSGGAAIVAALPAMAVTSAPSEVVTMMSRGALSEGEGLPTNTSQPQPSGTGPTSLVSPQGATQVSPPSVQGLAPHVESGSSLVAQAVTSVAVGSTHSAAPQLVAQPVVAVSSSAGVALESAAVASAPQAVLAAQQVVGPEQRLLGATSGRPITAAIETAAAVSAPPDDAMLDTAGQNRSETLPPRSDLTLARAVSDSVVVGNRGQVIEQSVLGQVADPVPSVQGATEGLSGVSARAVQDVQPSVSRQEVLQQVPQGADRATLPTIASTSAERVRLMVAQGERSISVRLVPASLGRIQIEVRSIGDELSIRIVSASSAVREAFEGQVSVLRDALARDGIQVSRVDVVSTTANGTDLGGRSNPGQETLPRRRSPQSTTNSFVEGNTSSATSDRSSARVPEHGGLNVLV